MRKTSTASSGRERLRSMVTPSANKQQGMDEKIDCLVRTVKEMRDKIACKSEIKMMITQIIREELEIFQRKVDEVKRSIEDKTTGRTGSYSKAVKKKKKESILIIQPLREPESKATKKVIKKV